MKSWFCGLVLLAGRSCTAFGQHEGTTLQFSLDRVGPPRAQYTVTLNDTGEGTYSPNPVPLGAGEGKPVEGEADSRTIHVGAGLVKKLFAAVPMVEGGRCETHNKGIAQTGVKVLRYQGAGRKAECSFNYSDDERVNEAESSFEALAETLRYGDRLRSKLRFDRLGLDNELDQLVSAVGEQRALEVMNIAPVLQAISQDERVMERARRKAAHLLDSAAAPAQTAAGVGSSDR